MRGLKATVSVQRAGLGHGRGRGRGREGVDKKKVDEDVKNMKSL